MRRAARVDDNQAEIVSALRRAGYLVESLAAVGAGFPDLLVGRCGWTELWLLEIKNLEGRGRKLKPAQVAWHALGWPVHIVTNPEEALAACQP